MTGDIWHFQGGIASATGRVRSVNQDSGYLDSRMVMIADGVGGGPAGEIASRLIVRSLVKLLNENVNALSTTSELRCLLATANGYIADHIELNPDHRGMATTLSAIIPLGNQMAIVHIGDSRIYLLRHSRLFQITRHDSVVQDLLDSGLITRDEALNHPLRTMLVHSLAGALSDSGFITLIPLSPHSGDRWILCSDGISDYLDNALFSQICRLNDDAASLADHLVDTACLYSRDNCSAAIVDVVAEESHIPEVFVGAACDHKYFECRA